MSKKLFKVLSYALMFVIGYMLTIITGLVNDAVMVYFVSWVFCMLANYFWESICLRRE